MIVFFFQQYTKKSKKNGKWLAAMVAKHKLQNESKMPKFKLSAKYITFTGVFI